MSSCEKCQSKKKENKRGNYFLHLIIRAASQFLEAGYFTQRSVELYATHHYVQVQGKPLSTDVEITAPRYKRGDHYTLPLVDMYESFLGFVHTRRKHNASIFYLRCLEYGLL